MFVAPPEVTALLQHIQPTVPMFNILDGYQDIQSVEAVLHSQETFALRDNTAQFKQGDGPIEIPDEVNRMRYLGYFLAEQLNHKRPFKFRLVFGHAGAHLPFVLLLRSFWLTGKRQVQIKQGLALQAETETNDQGVAEFEFEPLAELLKDPARILGFNVYLIRPKEDRRRPARAAEQESPPPPPPSGPFLNVLKKIDTRV